MKHWTSDDIYNLSIKKTGKKAEFNGMFNLKKSDKKGLADYDKIIKSNKPYMCRIFIGIDTGVNTGIAVYFPDSNLLDVVTTMKIHKAMELVHVNYNVFGDGLFVRVEDARKRKWIPKERGKEVLQGAGSIKRDASVWEDFLIDLGVRFEMVAPKSNKTKMTAMAFKKLTGWEKVCSNHARDAAMLVFGY